MSTMRLPFVNGNKSLIKKDRTEQLMLLPSMIILFVISIFPILYIIKTSFFDYSLSFNDPRFCYFDNWIKILKNTIFWSSWARTFIFIVLSLFLEIVLGITYSLLIFNLKFFKNMVLTFVMLPVFVAPIVVGLLGRFLLNTTYGLYAWIFSQIGFSSEIFSDPLYSFIAIVLLDVWEWTPLITLIVLAGLESMDNQPIEAALIDGASYLQRLFHIMLPLCSKVITIAIVIRSMDVIRYIDKISIITKGGPADATKISGWHLYEVAFRFQDFGQAAVLSIIMLFITILIAKIFLSFVSKGKHK